jgi:hypothetical protein
MKASLGSQMVVLDNQLPIQPLTAISERNEKYHQFLYARTAPHPCFETCPNPPDQEGVHAQ